jgi:hypothetical protein
MTMVLAVVMMIGAEGVGVVLAVAMISTRGPHRHSSEGMMRRCFALLSSPSIVVVLGIVIVAVAVCLSTVIVVAVVVVDAVMTVTVDCCA